MSRIEEIEQELADIDQLEDVTWTTAECQLESVESRLARAKDKLAESAREHLRYLLDMVRDVQAERQKLCVQMTQQAREAERKVAELETRLKGGWCAGCGHEVRAETFELARDEMFRHIVSCEKHPIRGALELAEAKARNDVLAEREACAKLIEQVVPDVCGRKGADAIRKRGAP